ncbi:MAG: hypothetical protein K9M49_02545 [Candidatus Marinimicrobia bacterium]|nr:hypothetical protein [Candidatus Neomarinimicrobiota bacterium]MCF7904012.1 hypothetical protein [Candidatus Neomarinimicrobiota bacterium]
MDIRNRDELLQKKEKLEAYLLENPQSNLYAWYTRQNMEAGELDRALKICRLGMQSAKEKGIYHKLLGEIYMAKGDVTKSMQHFVECILTKEPFPGVIIEVIKNFNSTLTIQQIAFLIKLLNVAVPGHPQVKNFYQKHPETVGLDQQADELTFLQELATNLQQSAMVEVIEEKPEPDVSEVPQEEKTEEDAGAKADEGARTPFQEPKPEQKPEPVVAKTEEKTPAADTPKRKPMHRKDPAIKHNITRSMATFTLMQIFKSQGMYENALEVLQLLREKSSNLERIEEEEKELRELMAGSDS